MRSFVSVPSSKGKEPDRETQTHEHTIWRMTQETLRKRGFRRQEASRAFCPGAEIVTISPCFHLLLAIIRYLLGFNFNCAISHIYFLYLSYNLPMLYTYISIYSIHILLNRSLIVVIINTERQTTRGRRRGQKPESGIKRRFKACASVQIFGFLKLLV